MLQLHALPNANQESENLRKSDFCDTSISLKPTTDDLEGSL